MVSFPLHEACERGDVTKAIELIQAGETIDKYNEDAVSANIIKNCGESYDYNFLIKHRKRPWCVP